MTVATHRPPPRLVAPTTLLSGVGMGRGQVDLPVVHGSDSVLHERETDLALFAGNRRIARVGQDGGLGPAARQRGAGDEGQERGESGDRGSRPGEMPHD
jgi:hypothetical protein